MKIICGNFSPSERWIKWIWQNLLILSVRNTRTAIHVYVKRTPASLCKIPARLTYVLLIFCMQKSDDTDFFVICSWNNLPCSSIPTAVMLSGSLSLSSLSPPQVLVVLWFTLMLCPFATPIPTKRHKIASTKANANIVLIRLSDGIMHFFEVLSLCIVLYIIMIIIVQQSRNVYSYVVISSVGLSRIATKLSYLAYVSADCYQVFLLHYSANSIICLSGE